MSTKCAEAPVLDLRNVHPDRIPDLLKPVRKKYPEIDIPFSIGDIEGKTVISQISADPFVRNVKRTKIVRLFKEEEQEFLALTNALKQAFSTIASRKTEESIRNARERWEECLREANGDLERACELYDQL